MTNYAAGHDAEKQAAAHIKELGFTVWELNWKTPRCEIDIVAEKNKRIYFVEVKYRKSTRHGTGLDHITPRKLEQMKYAAETWVSYNRWTGPYQLAVVSVSPKACQLLEDIT